jgi:hypothetical protein
MGTEKVMGTMMAIAPDRWSDLFDDLSRRNRGRIASIETYEPDGEGWVESHDVPFEGISISLDGDREVVSVVVQQDGRTHVLHTMAAPVWVGLEETEEEQVKTLQIESADGHATVIRFRPVTVPVQAA